MLYVSRSAGLALALVALAGCGGSSTSPTSVTPDDQGLHQAISEGRSGAEVTFNAALLGNPKTSNSHERMRVQSGAGDVLEIDHNVDLARPVPARKGDRLLVRGDLYIDPGQVGVHCTHKQTSHSCPQPGFIVLQGQTYD
jgi:hypothetical protein